MTEVIKKKRKVPFIYKLLSIVLSLITILLLCSIISLNVLNLPLLILVMVIILGISGLSILFMLKCSIKRISFITSIVLIFLYSILTFYFMKTTGFIKSLDLGYKTYNYLVVVKDNDSYDKLSDIKGLSVGYYNDGTIEVDKALNKVLNKIELDSIGYEDTYTLARCLLNDEVDAILIEKSYLDILDESINFKDDIKDIYDFNIISNTSDIVKDIDVVKEPFNIYVSGIDTYGSISSVSRSDVNMIISVNPDTRQILLTSIPRDYYVKLYGKSGYRDKLTHASLYGIDTSIRTIEDLFDIEINFYVKVNFSSVIDIVDAIGGIKVYSDYAFVSVDNYKYTKGYNKVNGEKTLSFVRERKAFIDGDRQRINNQQSVFRAIFDKCMSKDIITRYTRVLDSLKGSFITNMPMSRMTSLVKLQLAKNYSWNIMTNSLEGIDSSDYTYSTPKYKSYVMIPDEEAVDMASNLIKRVLNSDDFDTKMVSYVDNNDKLKVKLVRSSITIKKNEEYIYHGYSATYDGEDITNDKELKDEFIINNNTFDDYRDLVYYITYNLDKGTYIIKYNISYLDETKTLEQKLIIN